MPETEAERAARKAREAELRAKETPAEREARKAKEAERERRRAEETPEERAERKAREAAREKETPEQRAERKAREAERARAEETPEQRAERKAREAERARAEETPEQRAERKAREAQRRAEETPEQRAERKAREARAEETPQQRLERKAKEAERERAARDAADQPAKPLIHRSTTQQPPTAQSTTAASPARADMGSGNDGSSGGAMKPIQFQAPKKAEEEPDDYEDDFEEVFDAGALNEALKATEAENAKLRQQQQQQGGSSQGSGAKAGAAAEIVYEGKARAGFDADSLARQKHKVQFEKDLARAVALRRLVDLDEARFTIFDMSPQSQYEVFLRQMQSSAASTATADGKDNAAAPTVVGGLANSHAQGPEARVDIAIQAERVGRKVKGAQAPDDLGLFPEGAATKASAEASTAKNADEQTADGGDNAAAAAPKGPRVTALDKRRVDMNALGAFLANVFPCVRALLDENDAAADPTGKRRQADSGAAAAAKHAFTAGSTVLASPYADGRKVIRTEYSQLSPNYLLAAHGPLEGSPKTAEASRAAMHDGLALLWNVNDPTRPEKVLVAPAPIVDACLSPTKAYLVYAALSDGSMCVWDLRESEGVHGGNALNLGMRAPSYATGWNSADLHSASVRRLRVSGYNSAMGSAQRSADETEQLVSMDGTGSLNFWMVSAPDDRTAAATAAGSSLQMSSSIDDASKLGSTSGGGGGLKRNGSFSFGALSPSRRRGAGGSSGDGDCGLAVSSSVHLYRSSTVNCLTDVRAKSAAKRDTDLLGGGVGDDGFRIESTVYDMDISPTDPSHVLVGATAAVLHVSKFGAITAPSQYAPPGGMPPAVTAVSCCQGDSRLLLAGYDNGSCRLFLREESAPRLTVQLSPSAIVQVSWTFNKRWVAFVLDEMGQLFVLDFASSNKSKPVATATATDGSKLTTVSVGYDERETKLALGHASGRVEVHVFSDSVLPVPNLRDERWL